MKRLRLVKLVVHPTFVIDDGESLEEVQAQPVQVNAADLDGFAERFLADMADAERQLSDAPDVGTE